MFDNVWQSLTMLQPSTMGYGNVLVCYVFLLWSTLWCNIVKYHLHVCSQPIPIPASPDMIQMIRISGALSEKKRTWHQNIWRYLTLLSVGIFYWWLPLSKYWTSINILEMWAGAPAGDIVCTVLATLTPSMTKRAWNEGDFCIGDPISCLLTMGSTPI